MVLALTKDELVATRIGSTSEFTGVAGAHDTVGYFVATFRTGEGIVLATSDGIVGTLRIGRWLFTRAVEGVGCASLGSRSFRGWF